MGQEFEGKDPKAAERALKEKRRQERRRQFLDFIGEKFYRELAWHCEHYTIPKCPHRPELICINSLDAYWPNPKCELHSVKHFPLLLNNEFVVDVDQDVMDESEIFEKSKVRYDKRIKDLKTKLCGK